MNDRIDFTSKMSYHYQQAEQILHHLINTEKYYSGTLFPDEMAMTLAREFGIFRNILRQAINRLVAEKLRIRKKEVGTMVNTSGKACSNDRTG